MTTPKTRSAGAGSRRTPREEHAEGHSRVVAPDREGKGSEQAEPDHEEDRKRQRISAERHSDRGEKREQRRGARDQPQCPRSGPETIGRREPVNGFHRRYLTRSKVVAG
jgi:hypothetical protein